jgi:hypothetical protein
MKKSKFILSFLCLFAISFIISPIAAGAVAVGGYMLTNTPGLAFTNAITISQFNSLLGDVIKIDQTEILRKVFERTETLKYCSTITGVQDGQIYAKGNASIDEVVQKFTTTWAAKGNITMKPQTITQRRHKVNFAVTPDDYVGTWLGYLTDEKLTPEQYPFVKYILYNLILPQIQEDRELQQFYKGVYNGSADEASAGMDGFGELIENGLEAGTINGIDIGGELSEGNTYAQMKLFRNGLPNKFKTIPMFAFMAPEMLIDYLEDREDTVGAHVITNDKNPNQVPLSNLTLVGLPSMADSKRVFATVPGNMLRIVDQVNDVGRVYTQQQDYVVKIFIDWHEAVGFGYNELVFANNFSNSGSGGGDEEEILSV